ncbi:hypothetical protein [Psychrobacter sp. DAB_AL62B]|uniref:hypothetical protein n=1 Tax=Psychrobacter sp. DAB_AL62B TaxID=1028420 RepID=UPI002381249B|nr:hypothetical protein [Psychrobacter sp. DAB_AL62B]MDE4455600.1 hypothetical protein [Psychrobacter sp. DAB_AL62B]
MKKILVALALMVSSVSSFAGLPEMMKVYNNPKSAPKIAACKGDIYCNSFIALSKQWKDIPNSYRYQGKWDIKAFAKRGVTYNNQGRNIGLESQSYYLHTDKANKISEGVSKYIETKKHTPDDNEGGLAVLLYIEDKNGWAKD